MRNNRQMPRVGRPVRIRRRSSRRNPRPARARNARATRAHGPRPSTGSAAASGQHPEPSGRRNSSPAGAACLRKLGQPRDGRLAKKPVEPGEKGAFRARPWARGGNGGSARGMAAARVSSCAPFVPIRPGQRAGQLSISGRWRTFNHPSVMAGGAGGHGEEVRQSATRHPVSSIRVRTCRGTDPRAGRGRSSQAWARRARAGGGDDRPLWAARRGRSWRNRHEKPSRHILTRAGRCRGEGPAAAAPACPFIEWTARCQIFA